MLAARAVMEQGVQVEGLNFFTGFCVEGHTQAIRNQSGQKKPKRNNALWAAKQLGIPLHIVDIVEDYQDVVLNPQYGYGANLNPCLDCKVFMVKRAWQWAQENGFDFIITGEVVGQRPKSQRKDTLPLINEVSGVHDRLLRPLCAKKLAPTLPEREGWVDREKLYGFWGRSRKPQFALAEAFGIEEYAQPAGGCCFLTDPNYTQKLSDLWSARGEKKYSLDDIMLLKVGRHFRPKPHYKVIIARDEGESRYLSGYRKQFVSIDPISHPGAYALVDGEPTPDDYPDILALCARYTQRGDAPKVTLTLTDKAQVAHQRTIIPMKADEIPKEWLL